MRRKDCAGEVQIVEGTTSIKEAGARFAENLALGRRVYSSLARETWREICVSVADIFHMQISAHPRGAFISVGDCNPD